MEAIAKIAEHYVVLIKDLIEENETKFNFEGNLNDLKKNFDQEVQEDKQKLVKELTSYSFDESLKDEINKLASEKMKQCLKELIVHIDFAIEQRSQIELNSKKQLVNDFLILINDYFENEIKNYFTKLDIQDQLIQNSQQELKKIIEPIQNLFKKEIENVTKELKLLDDSFNRKLNCLSRQIRLISFDSDEDFKILKLSSEVFSSVFNKINQLIDNLINDEKVLDNQIKVNLASNLQNNLNLIIEKLDKFSVEYRLSLNLKLEQKSDKNFDEFENFKKKIKILFSDLEKKKDGPNFYNLTIKILNLKTELDLEQIWNRFYKQIKSYDLIQLLDFELDYIDLHSDLESYVNKVLKRTFFYCEKLSNQAGKPKDHLLKF